MFSGLPGSGKTTLARRLATRLQLPLFSKDAIDAILRDDGLVEGSSLTGYHLLMDLAEQQLTLGISPIIDAVFPMREFREHVALIVQRQMANLYIIHTYCSDEMIYRQRMADRVQYHRGWTAKGWEEVERLRPIYEPWIKQDALFLDAMDNIEQNLDKLLNYIL